MLSVILACGILGTLIIWKMTGKKYKLPPGPAGLPYVGNALQIDNTALFKTMTNWADEYGDVMKYKMYGKNMVILSGFENIYEALVTNATSFAGRPYLFRPAVMRKHCEDVAFTSYSKNWANLKKVTMQGMKMHGNNLEGLERISLDQIHELIDEMKGLSKSGEPVELKPMFYQCIAGIIMAIMYGHKIEKESITGLLKAQALMIENLLPRGLGSILDIAPAMRFILRATFQHLVNTRDLYAHWFNKNINERRIKYEPGNPECFVDTLFEAQHNGKVKGHGFQLTDDNIYGISNNMMQAGTITTSLSLQCLIPILVNNPSIQDKMANSIFNEIGTEEPRLVHREKLAYIDAAILELLRYSSIQPMNLPHTTIVDVKINGYDIPKDTRVYCNLWKLHHDPKYWDEPNVYRPERFLEEDGSLVAPDHINRKRLLPFGASRRVCVGEILAKNRLFLLITSLIQHFTFLPVSEQERPDSDPKAYISGFGVKTKSYKVRLEPRCNSDFREEK